jgi:hypothetical protein
VAALAAAHEGAVAAFAAVMVHEGVMAALAAVIVREGGRSSNRKR